MRRVARLSAWIEWDQGGGRFDQAGRSRGAVTWRGIEVARRLLFAHE